MRVRQPGQSAAGCLLEAIGAVLQILGVFALFFAVGSYAAGSGCGGTVLTIGAALLLWSGWVAAR